MSALSPAYRFLVRQQIKRDEGLRLDPYFDTVGKLTIGYGRNLSDTGISQAEAELMLDHDLDACTADLLHTFPFVADLDPVRQGILMQMCFQMGIGKLTLFTKMWTALQGQDYARAAEEMMQSRWSDQTGARATRLATAMLRGE